MNLLIENIQHFSLHDGPGTRTTVFFKGCPLRCVWCSNPTTQEFRPELLQKAEKCLGCGACVTVCPQRAVTARPGLPPGIDRAMCTDCGGCALTCAGKALLMAGHEYTLASVMEAIVADMPFYLNSGGGVTLSGGEVLSQCEGAVALCEECHAFGIQTAAETSGYAPYEKLRRLSDETDILFMDIKHVDDAEHRRLTGVGNALILDNLARLLKERPAPVHVRLPLVPGCNDSDGHLAAYAALLSGLEGNLDLEVLPYHRLGRNKYEMLGRSYALGDIAPPDKEHVAHAIEVLRAGIGRIPVACTA
ncbi:MAG: glycyl-radical enzyme activating protein [Desulfovibrio sp.]|nr:glycyl-radical enzyme activating protein [Desulfovibrio sp.]